MDRMKTFGLYALCIILFFVFSNIMINFAIKGTYKTINANVILKEDLKINVNDVKATYINGYVEGNVINTGEYKDIAYVKIDLYSRRDNLLGTKYVKMPNIRKNETRQFRTGFEFTDVKRAEIKMVDEVGDNVTEEQFSTKEMRFAKLLATIILISFFG